jgi:anti-sigma factor ChrR (cupin superfamily)
MTIKRPSFLFARKARGLARVNVSSAFSLEHSMSGHGPAAVRVVPHEIAWQELLPGIWRKRLWAELAPDGASAVREVSMVRYDPGVKVPLHKHVGGDEVVFTIEGVLSDEYGDITAGNVGYRPAGCVHSLHSATGATTLSYLTGGSEMLAVRPADTPPSEIFNVGALPWKSTGDPRVQTKVIWRDAAGTRRFLLGKIAPGFTSDLHTHEGDEFLFLLEGALTDGAGLLRAGDVGLRPRGCRHAFSSQAGSLGISYVWGSSDYDG